MTSLRFRHVVAAVAAVALLLPAAAAAAPDKTFVLDAATSSASWDGAQGNYSYFYLAPVVEYDVNNCSKDSDSYCEQFLLDVRSAATPVKLDASLTEFSNPSADFDLYMYKSDATGKATGEPLDGGSGTGGASGEDEVWTNEEIEPGYYLLVAVHFFNPNATYKGNVKVTGATPVPGGGGPAPTPPSPSPGTPPPSGGFTTLPFKVPATLGSAKKAKKKKALSFKATASADITNLTIALVDRRKKVVARASFARFAKGSRTIQLKVRKLKKGSYDLLSEGTVDGNRLRNLRKVRVKA